MLRKLATVVLVLIASLAPAAASSATTATSLSISASPTSPQVVGRIVTFEVAITPQSVGGTVRLYDGNVLLGAGSDYATLWSYTTSNLAVGTHHLTATFDPNDASVYSSSSAVATYVITAEQSASTTTKLTVSNVAPAVGAAVTLTANVTPATASGSVKFFDGPTLLGASTCAGGAASLSTSALPKGQSTVQAIFVPTSGSSLDGSTSNAVTVNVGGSAAQVTTLTVTPATGVTPSTLVSATAQVTPATNDGIIRFYDGTTTLGSAALSSSRATWHGHLDAGSHVLSATYFPNASGGGGSSSDPQTISVGIPFVHGVTKAGGGSKPPGAGGSGSGVGGEKFGHGSGSGSGKLPFTGAEIASFLVAAGLLVACGLPLAAVRRRRRERAPARGLVPAAD